MMRAEASWCKPFRWISEVDDFAAPQTGWARALMLRYAGALPHANLASVPNSLNVPAGLSDDPQGRQAKLRLRTRSAGALFCEATSSVITLNPVSSLEPKLVEIATSAASRP
jgi:hypothetical protein